MDIYGLNEIYDSLKRMGYIKDNEEGSENSRIPDIDPSGGADENCCRDLNLDIPGGFQDINPMVFITIGEVIGNVLAGNIPFNVTASLANWLNLIGQAVETYAAQQMYFQSGPGRCYDLRDRNVANPFCSCQEQSDNNNKSESQDNDSSNDESEENSSNNNCNTNESDINIENLEDVVKSLKEEVENYSSKINELENIIKKYK